MVDLLSIVESHTNQRATWHYADLAHTFSMDPDNAATDNGRRAIRERTKKYGRRAMRDTSLCERRRIAGVVAVCLGYWLRSVEGSGWDPDHPVLVDYIRMWAAHHRPVAGEQDIWPAVVAMVRPVAHRCLPVGASYVDVAAWTESGATLLSE